MDYLLGNNPFSTCMVTGFASNSCKNVHHRAASGLSSASNGNNGYVHTLTGALVGGPTDAGGSYNDDIGDYVANEVAIDYNAGYTAALCAMVGDYGGTIDPSFPPTETPKWDEWQITSALNGKGNNYTEIKAWAKNYTAWPARVAKDISYRYFFDVSELLEKGLSVDDITVEGKSQQYQAGQQGYGTVSGPHHYDGNIYYQNHPYNYL